ncbi:hypothetical protein ACJX0J_025028 [Zea mays]
MVILSTYIFVGFFSSSIVKFKISYNFNFEESPPKCLFHYLHHLQNPGKNHSIGLSQKETKVADMFYSEFKYIMAFFCF